MFLEIHSSGDRGTGDHSDAERSSKECTSIMGRRLLERIVSKRRRVRLTHHVIVALSDPESIGAR
jgi:hypothetical protein